MRKRLIAVLVCFSMLIGMMVSIQPVQADTPDYSKGIYAARYSYQQIFDCYRYPATPGTPDVVVDENGQATIKVFNFNYAIFAEMKGVDGSQGNKDVSSYGFPQGTLLKDVCDSVTYGWRFKEEVLKDKVFFIRQNVESKGNNTSVSKFSLCMVDQSEADNPQHIIYISKCGRIVYMGDKGYIYLHQYNSYYDSEPYGYFISRDEAHSAKEYYRENWEKDPSNDYYSYISKNPNNSFTEEEAINYDSSKETTPKYDYSIYGKTLSLKGDIGVNYYLDLGESFAQDERLSVELNVDGGKTFTYSNSDGTLAGCKVGNSNRYKFTATVKSTQMTNTITMSIKIGNQVTTQDVYSVEKYITNKLGVTGTATTNDNLKVLLKAMAKYGDAAQKQFVVNGATPMRSLDKLDNWPEYNNPDLSGFQLKTYGTQPEMIKQIGCTLVLDSTVTLRYRLYLNKGSSLEDYTITDCYSNTITPVKDTDYSDNECDVYILDIKNIYAYDLDDKCYFKMTEKNSNKDVFAYEYGPMTYVYNMLNDDSETLQELVKSIYVYNQCAKAYFDGLNSTSN